MLVIKRIFVFMLLLSAVVAAYWIYLRITLGEGGCSVKIVWMDESDLGKEGVIYQGQVHVENFFLFDYLAPNLSYYMEGGYMSEVDIHSKKGNEVRINNLEVHYIFGDSELKPVALHLTRYDSKAQPISDQSLPVGKIVDLYLDGNEYAHITFIYDFDADEAVFSRGEIQFTFEYTRNGKTEVINHVATIVRVTSKYNCLWGQ